MGSILFSNRAIARIHAAIIVVIIIVAGVAGAYYYLITTQGPPPPATEILIGTSVSITGKYADSGRWHIEAYKLWEKQVNEKGGLLGRTVRFIIYDDKSDPTTAVSNYERLITVDKVDLLVGGYASEIVFASSSVAEKYGYLFVEGGGRSVTIFTRGYKYTFLTMPCLAEDDGRGFIEFIDTLPAAKKPKTFAFICEDTLYPISTSVGAMAYVIGGVKNAWTILGWLGDVSKVTFDSIKSAAQRVKNELGYESPYEVVFFEKYAKGTTDVSPIISKIKAIGADVLYVGGYLPDSVMAVRACKELDYNPMAIFATVGPSMPDFGLSLKDDAMYVWCGIMFHSETSWSKEFVESYKKEWGRAPDYHAGTAYAACQVIEAAVRGTGSLNNTVLRDWVASRNTPEKAVTTVVGPLYWDERGVCGYAGMVTQWLKIPEKRGLADYLVWPLSVREVDPVWPMPKWSERS